MAPDRKPDEAQEAEETAEIETEQETETEEVETEETVEEAETEEETDEAEAEETETEEVETRPQTRGNRQFGELRRQLRETRQELETLKRGRQAPDPGAAAAQAQRDKEEEERVLLSGDPAAISRFFSERAEKRIEGRLSALASHTVDSADKARFERLCAKNPTIAAIEDEVEDKLAEFRANGANPQREAVAYYLLGQRMAKRGPAARTRQERKAATERQRQQARPGNSRSDTPRTPARGRLTEQQARAKRLDESGML